MGHNSNIMRYQGIDRVRKPVGGGSETIDGPEGLRRGIWWGAAIVTLCLVGGARAAGKPRPGHSATQLFRLGLFGLSQIARKRWPRLAGCSGSIASCARTIRRAEISHHDC